VGAPWLDREAVIAAMERHGLPGVGYQAVEFTPEQAGDGKFEGVAVRGVRLVVSDRARYDPAATAIHLLAAIRALHPDSIRIGGSFDRLAGGPGLREALERGEHPASIVGSWGPSLAAFRERVQPFLLYR
jgi:uncharacterized protein YbbC (DUF1343 family)